MAIVIYKTVDDDGWHYVAGTGVNYAISHASWEKNGYGNLSDAQLVKELVKLNGSIS